MNRPRLLAAVAVPLLFAAGVVAGRLVAADESAPEDRLVVVADRAMRSRVVEALAPLGARVYDATTMERLDRATSELSSSDALTLFRAVMRDVDAARDPAGRPALSARQVSMRGVESVMLLRVSWMPAVDALLDALRRNPGIVPGTIRAVDDVRAATGEPQVRVSFVPALPPATAEPTRLVVPEDVSARVRAVVAARSATFVDVTPVTRRDDGLSQVAFTLEVADAAKILPLLEALHDVASVRITAVSWATPEPSKPVRVAVQVVGR
jgi:hypothetical protein